jgi:hypothetical protein
VEDEWVISPGDAASRVKLTLRNGPPRPLVATLTEAELESVADVLPEVAQAVRRGEFSRIRLGAAFRDRIGRDPFTQTTAASRRRGLYPWWAGVSFLVIGLGFAAGHSNPLLRLAGSAIAAIALGDLVGHVWRRLRR